MQRSYTRGRGMRSSRVIALGAAACGVWAASMQASARTVGPGEKPEASRDGVVRVRRAQSPGGQSDVGVVRSRRAAAIHGDPSDDAIIPGLIRPSVSGSIRPDSGDSLDDMDPIGAGLPDAQPGEAGRPPGASQELMLADIGVRGRRSGRTVMLVGAEVAFADCGIDVRSGTPLGCSGVMGRAGANPGSAPSVVFELQSGGRITLSVQPLPSGSPSAPLRPIRTVTMQVP